MRSTFKGEKRLNNDIVFNAVYFIITYLLRFLHFDDKISGPFLVLGLISKG